MTDVVSLDAFKKAKMACEAAEQNSDGKVRFSGLAECAVCRHQWTAKQESPAWAFPCERCHVPRAYFVNSIELPEGTARAVCRWCDYQAFQVTTLGSFCLGCGAYHSWDNMPSPA